VLEVEEPIDTADRFALPIILFALTLPSLVTFVYFNLLAESAGWMQQTAYAVGKAIQFGLPILWVWLFYRWRLSRNRERKPASRTDVLFSVGLGVGVCVVLAVAWFGFIDGSKWFEEGLLSQIKKKVGDLAIDSLWKYAMLSVFYALCHSFLEEYYWRWFVYDMLKRITTVPVANFVSSLGFMAHHVLLLAVYFGWSNPMTYLCSAGVAIGGMFWAWIYQRTGSLFWPWISHMIVDAGLFLLGYVVVKDMLV